MYPKLSAALKDSGKIKQESRQASRNNRALTNSWSIYRTCKEQRKCSISSKSISVSWILFPFHVTTPRRGTTANTPNKLPWTNLILFKNRHSSDISISSHNSFVNWVWLLRRESYSKTLGCREVMFTGTPARPAVGKRLHITFCGHIMLIEHAECLLLQWQILGYCNLQGKKNTHMTSVSFRNLGPKSISVINGW